MLYKKILVASSLLVVLFMLYLIPTKKEVEFAETNLEYVYPNDLETVYLLDSNDYVARVLISASNDSIISKATSLIDALTIGGKKENVIPNGFRSIIPSGTKVNDIELEDGVLVRREVCTYCPTDVLCEDGVAGDFKLDTLVRHVAHIVV